MGLFDGLRELFGTRAESDAARGADPEDLFQLSTGYVTMAVELEFDSAGTAALCFAEVDSTDFRDAVGDVESILAVGERETGTTARLGADDRGYSWVVLADDDFEDLVTSVHFAADALVERGYGSRLLAAVFAFERSDGDRSDGVSTADGSGGGQSGEGGGSERVYWIYSFRRGAFYPFAPRAGRSRDERLEFKLVSVLDGELDVDDEEYWYPLWPGEPGGHPWE